MNSLGVSPYVNCLSSDLADGLIIFQLYEIISPGCVEWNKVTRKFSRMKKFMEKIQNCNYVVELGRRQKYSLVGIAGKFLIISMKKSFVILIRIDKEMFVNNFQVKT
jgi:plastin-3